GRARAAEGYRVTASLTRAGAGDQRDPADQRIAECARTIREDWRVQVTSRSDTYTHGHHDAVLRSHRWRTAENSAAYLLPLLRPGSRLLDVGCGPGTLTVDLARRIAPGGAVGLALAHTV